MVHKFKVKTSGKSEMADISREIAGIVRENGVESGVCHIFTPHTSCGLAINENADPDVRRDLESFFSRLVPDGDRLFVHTAEGEDDMSAHIRTALTAVNLSIPVTRGRLALGTWQGLYLWEHRTAPLQRTIAAHFIGE